MALTQPQIDFGFAGLAKDLLNDGPMAYTKPELKEAIIDMESWINSPGTQGLLNAALTNGNFKANSTTDQKRLALTWTLTSITQA